MIQMEQIPIRRHAEGEDGLSKRESSGCSRTTYEGEEYHCGAGEGAIVGAGAVETDAEEG